MDRDHLESQSKVVGLLEVASIWVDDPATSLSDSSHAVEQHDEMALASAPERAIAILAVQRDLATSESLWLLGYNILRATLENAVTDAMTSILCTLQVGSVR